MKSAKMRCLGVLMGFGLIVGLPFISHADDAMMNKDDGMMMKKDDGMMMNKAAS